VQLSNLLSSFASFVAQIAFNLSRQPNGYPSTNLASENFTGSESALNMASQRLSDIISLLLSFSEVPVLLGAAALIVAVVSYLAFAGPTPASTSSRKVQQAKAMREAYESMEKQSSRADRNRAKVRSLVHII
jgi:hypothetical protein